MLIKGLYWLNNQILCCLFDIEFHPIMRRHYKVLDQDFDFDAVEALPSTYVELYISWWYQYWWLMIFYD